MYPLAIGCVLSLQHEECDRRYVTFLYSNVDSYLCECNISEWYCVTAILFRCLTADLDACRKDNRHTREKRNNRLDTLCLL